MAGAVFFVPGSILGVGAGLLFGLANGIVYVPIGATLGATGALLIATSIVRDWVARKLRGNQEFNPIDQTVAREG
jgi:uncharacterized membrane protein YdjX (TVP38/TMEM64 family)